MQVYGSVFFSLYLTYTLISGNNILITHGFFERQGDKQKERGEGRRLD